MESKKIKGLKGVKGITLIALVITIIVLLILAAVSIATLTGENGILTQATRAADATEQASVEEEVNTDVIGSYDDRGKFQKDVFKERIEAKGGEIVVETEDEIIVEFKGYEVTVDAKTGEVKSVEKAEGVRPEISVSQSYDSANKKVTVTVEVTNDVDTVDEITVTNQDTGEEIPVQKDGKKGTFETETNGMFTVEVKATTEGKQRTGSKNMQVKDIEITFSTRYGKIEVVWVNKSNEIIEEPLAPVLNGMTPVYWDEDGTEHETEAENSNWYKYVAGNNKDDSKNSYWANAINTTKDDDGNDVKSYFVWIPRYAYRIIYYGNKACTKVTGYSDGRGIVDSKGNVVTKRDEGIEVTKEYNGYKYIVHPAFETNVDNGGWDTELSGIWVGKYETSKSTAQEGSTSIGSGTKIKVVPNVRSWSKIYVDDCYTYSKEYDEEKESHLIKNSEWGAVAYLTHSQYGRNSNEVSVNQCDGYCMTGAGRGTGDSAIYNSYYGWSAITDEQKYNGEIGKDSSSTGNIYGVYDLSGGAFEYVAAFNKDGTKLGYGSSFTKKEGIFNGETITESNKWVTVYSSCSTTSREELYEIGKTGDATKEVWAEERFAWNSDNFESLREDYPFIKRGSNYSYQWPASYAGIFTYKCGDGTSSTSDDNSFRVVLPGV